MKGIVSRGGMALVTVLAVVSLLAILAVATLSVTTRLRQGSTLTMRDVRLDAAASFGLTTALLDWRRRELSSLAIGSSSQVGVAVPGNPGLVSVTITRVGAELFWLVADAVAVDDSRRRENLVVRLSLPRTDSIAPFLIGGDAMLSHSFSIARDTSPGCAPVAADLLLSAGAALSSVDGLPGSLIVERSPSSIDSTQLLHIGAFSLATLAESADLVVQDGMTMQAPSGVVHATGNLTLSGGTGQGILIVDGRLTLAGPISFTGLIVARGGVLAASAGAEIKGSIRVGATGSGDGMAVDIRQPFAFRPSACATQDVLRSAVMPHKVSGWAWTEIY